MICLLHVSNLLNTKFDRKPWPCLKIACFHPISSPKPKDILFTTSGKAERQEILTFEKLKQQKVRHFCLMNVGTAC